MKLVQQAKEYVKKHEGQLQERLAMSKSTRDIFARFHILVVKVITIAAPLLFVIFQCAFTGNTRCCDNIAMAAQQTGGGQLHKPNNSLGVDYQRDRVSIRHSGRFVFHVPPLVVLGEFGHIRVVGSFRRHTRSIYTVEFRMWLNKCYKCN